MQRLPLIINFRTLYTVILAVLSTWVCVHYGIKADLPITLLVTAVVFPVVFSIHSAYERRERVLGDYASLKSQGRALYYATRDWLDMRDEVLLERYRRLLRQLLESCVHLLNGPHGELEQSESAVYRAFSELSRFIRDEHRQRGMAATEVSRANQYLNTMLGAFESIKHVYQYRTPQTLKVFGNFFLLLLPPMYGPLFAHLLAGSYTGLVYVLPVMFAVILAALANIQDQLENPFDQYGEDDVSFSVDKYIASLEPGPTAGIDAVSRTEADNQVPERGSRA
ncbi:hypothetical protein [Haliea sp. E17]|uniref:hypothetical protein n=1 Tax=Haliea sp. E17 TaxID=3401576 RepID=UPI003AAFDBAC